MSKTLVISNHKSAVDYHRLIIPFKNIENVVFGKSEEFINNNPQRLITRQFLRENDISVVWFSRNISPFFLDPTPLYRTIKEYGAKIVIDLDDYPEVDYGSIFYDFRIRTNLKKCEISQIQYADHVCVTHDYLRNLINKDYNVPKHKIIIAPNGIDPNETQYNQEFDYKLDNMFWQGSVTHHNDLKIMSEAVNETGKKIFIAGYDADSHTVNKDETKTYHWEETGKLFNRKQWIHSKPVTEYMNFYKGKGLCLIPLEKTKFTQCKSNLKMLEAGWAKKPVICSGIHPYTSIGKDGKNCEFAYTKEAWKESIEYILENPNYADDLRHELHQNVKDNYLINKVNESRINLINKIK